MANAIIVEQSQIATMAIRPPVGKTDIHDFRRIMETFLEAFLSFVIVWLLGAIPHIDFGSATPAITIALIPALEYMKRLLDGQTPTPGAPSA